MAEGGGGLSVEDVKEILPDWIFWGGIARLAGQIRSAGGPVRWVRQRIVDYILGAVAALIFSVAGVIDQMWGIVILALEQAGGVVPPSIQMAGAPVTNAIEMFHGAIRDVATVAGPASPIIVVGIYALVFYLGFIALRAASPALSDLLGSIPVVGSLGDAALTFAVEAGNRVYGYLGGDG